MASARTKVLRRVGIGVVVFLVVAALAAWIGLGHMVYQGITHLTKPEETHTNTREHLAKNGYNVDEALTDLKAKGVTVKEGSVESSTNDYAIPTLELTDPATTRIAILVHGLGDTKLGTLPVAEMFVDMGYNVIAYDQANAGDREPGLNTFGVKESDDTLDVLTYVEERGASEIVLWGTSYGGATSAYAAGKAGDRLDAVILDSPMSSGYDMTREVLGQIEDETGLPVDVMLSAAAPHYRLRAGVTYDELDAAAALEGTPLPVLIIHSRDDDVTAPYMAEEFERAVGEGGDSSVDRWGAQYGVSGSSRGVSRLDGGIFGRRPGVAPYRGWFGVVEAVADP